MGFRATSTNKRIGSDAVNRAQTTDANSNVDTGVITRDVPNNEARPKGGRTTKKDLRASWSYEFHDEIEPTLAFFYTPRTITMLVLMLSGILYAALFVAGEDVVANTKMGLSAAVMVILLTGLLEFKDGPFIRPHPAFWRVVLAVGVTYEIFLVFVLFQDKHTMRGLLKFIDPNLGVPLPEKSYAEDCSITAETLWNQTDIFVLAHTLGWFAKYLVLRDYWFCWILSVLFEVMEYSLQHQLPNFAECWWDHWILDVLTTNWLGIYMGMKVCRYFEMKQYSWRGINEIPTVKGKLQRTIEQFTPHSWTSFQWKSLDSFKNYAAVIGLLTIELQLELNAFYLKYLLWIPSEHFINIARLVMYFFLCMPAVREAYQYLTDKNCKKFGMHAWITTANILTEALICVKFGQGEFPNPTPKPVLIFWAIFLSCLAIYPLYAFVLKKKTKLE
ncbi:phosphatidyl serine synthase-domain-containing protein [Zopfochytrium polystomum]|nr:phosphatidyl serine synthase-domain-containing protein [Zopfochytrium polystomum]